MDISTECFDQCIYKSKQQAIEFVEEDSRIWIGEIQIGATSRGKVLFTEGLVDPFLANVAGLRIEEDIDEGELVIKFLKAAMLL